MALVLSLLPLLLLLLAASLLLLLLLLDPLYFSPHQVSRLSQHRYRIALLWSLELQHALHLPDTLKSTCQILRGALLLLLAASLLLATSLLLAAFLLLTTLRHTPSYLTLTLLH